MNYNEFSKLVLSRQSCRDFSGEKISDETLDKIMSTSINCPSARNIQPWKLCLVKTEDKFLKVKKCLQKDGKNAFLDNASAFVAVCEKEESLKEGNSGRFTKYDVGEMVAYITLTAESLNVKSCIIGWMDEEALRKELGLKDDELCHMVVALGMSDIKVRDKVRKSKEEVVTVL